MFCRNCGTDVTNMKYCPKCGTRNAVENENVATDEKLKDSKVKRKYVLAIFGIGIALFVIVVTVLLLKSFSKMIGNTTVPTMNAVEETPQEAGETKDEITTQNWWKDKAFQSTDSGLYFWIEEDGNELWFMVGPEYLNNQNCLVVGSVDKSEISVDINREDEFVRYRFHDDILKSSTSVQYFYNKNEVLLLSKSDLNGKWLNESGTYQFVETAEQPDEAVESEAPVLEPRYYECFETSGGWDAEIEIYYSSVDESIEVTIIRIAGGTLNLENEDQNPIIYSGYWEDFDSQVTLTISDDSPEITFTATGELEQYNGTYIQLPDPGTDGEN